MEEIEFSRWLFEGRPRQGKNVLPDGLNWLCYFVGSSKSHRENSISFIFLEFPHQVDMEKILKSSKHFFGYFNTLETHSALLLRQSVDCRLHRASTQYQTLGAEAQKVDFIISTFCPTILSYSVVLQWLTIAIVFELIYYKNGYFQGMADIHEY